MEGDCAATAANQRAEISRQSVDFSRQWRLRRLRGDCGTVGGASGIVRRRTELVMGQIISFNGHSRESRNNGENAKNTGKNTSKQWNISTQRTRTSRIITVWRIGLEKCNFTATSTMSPVVSRWICTHCHNFCTWWTDYICAPTCKRYNNSLAVSP